MGNCARTTLASNLRGAADRAEASKAVAAGAGAGWADEPAAARAAALAAACAGLRFVTASPDLVPDHVPQLIADALERDAVEHRGEEALDDQALRLEPRQAARHEVVHLLGVDVPDRGPVGAAHVVGEDLEPRDAVRARRL